MYIPIIWTYALLYRERKNERKLNSWSTQSATIVILFAQENSISRKIHIGLDKVKFCLKAQNVRLPSITYGEKQDNYL